MLSIVLRVVNTLCTIATEALLVRHYRISLELLKAKQILRPSGKSMELLKLFQKRCRALVS